MENPDKPELEDLHEAVYPTKLTDWGYVMYDRDGPVHGCYRTFIPSDGEEAPE